MFYLSLPLLHWSTITPGFVTPRIEPPLRAFERLGEERRRLLVAPGSVITPDGVVVGDGSARVDDGLRGGGLDGPEWLGEAMRKVRRRSSVNLRRPRERRERRAARRRSGSRAGSSISSSGRGGNGGRRCARGRGW